MEIKIAQNITSLRKAAGLTQEQLAERLFVTRQAVSKWERGESRPDLDTVVALAQLFSVSVDGLVSGEIAPAEKINPAEIADDDGFRHGQRRKLVRSLVLWAFFVCAFLCLAVGVVFSSLAGRVEHIWLVWLALPVLAPLAVLVRFYGFFGRAWAPYFVNVPIICMFVFEMLVFFAPESEGSWLCFLFIPLYYAAAAVFTVSVLRRSKGGKGSPTSSE